MAIIWMVWDMVGFGWLTSFQVCSVCFHAASVAVARDIGAINGKDVKDGWGVLVFICFSFLRNHWRWQWERDTDHDPSSQEQVAEEVGTTIGPVYPCDAYLATRAAVRTRRAATLCV